MNFKQKSTREQLLFSYRNLLYSFVLSLLFFNGFSQSNTNEFNLSPNGVLDNVFDQFGNHYYLENLMVDSNTNESISSKATLLSCSPTSIFNLYFEPGSGMEVVSNPTQNAINAARRAVICQVFQDVSNFITQPNSPLQPNSQTKVNIWVRDITLLSGVPSNVLGLATSFYCVPYKNDTSNPTFGGITDSEIWKTIHTGEDSYKSFSSPLNPTSLNNDTSGAFYHGMIAFKFTNVNWHTTLNDLATSTEHDLYTIALHEIIHALGIATLIGADGNSLLGSGFNYYSRYDKFLKTNDTLQPLISNSNNSCSLYNYSFASNTNAIHPSCPNGNSNSGTSIDTTICNDAVKFVGSSIIIPVYTPTCYELGSSLSHFEDQLFPLCDPDPHYVNNEYFVMSNTTGVGINKRYIKPEERLALTDIGYSAKTSFGLTSTANGSYNYTGSVLQGITVAGVNDGLDYNGSAYIFSGNVGNDIPISILGNDKNVDGFECLKDVYDASALLNMSLTLSGTASTNINFRSSTPGIHLLRYIPINSITGQKGNITYVFVNVIGPYSCTINNICDLVANGNFEQHFSLPTNIGQLRNIITCGWGPGNGGTPDYYRADSFYQPIQVPCNNFGFENDNVNGNIAYAGMNFISSPNGVTTASEPIMTLLRTPILSGGAYQLSFDVSISETAFKSIRFQAYICSNLSPALGSYQSEIPIDNTGIFLENESFSNVSDGWEKVVFNIPASATLGLAPLRYLYIGGLGGPTHVKYQNRTVSNQVAGCNYHSDWGGDNHYYVDNVSLVPTYGGTFSPPSTISCTASSINLTDYLSGLPTDGVFTGSGVTSTFFNPSVAGEGTKTITYTYNSSCSIPLFANINVTPAVVPTFTQVAPICSGTTLAALPTISNNGYEGSWSPGLNNTTTTTYTFTPNDSYCIGKTTMTIIVNPNKIPNFYPIGPICSGDNFTLQTTSINNVTGSWGPDINNTTTTTYTFTPSPGQCATSPVLTVIVNPKPQAPISTAQTYCSGATVASLSVTGVAGATFSWYSVANGGTALAASAQLSTTTYYVSQTINGCTSPRKAVAVTINPIPAPPTATAQTYCNGATVANLIATGITGATFSWYSSATDGIALPFTTLLTTGTYYVSQSLNGCSSTRIPVSLIINNCLPTCTLSLTSANTTTNQTLCLGNLITPITYATTGNPTNVTVTGLPTGINGVYNNGIFTITGTPTVAGVYNYTLTTVGCVTNITATGIITVKPIVTPTFTFATTLCARTTAPILPDTSFEGITGTWNPATVSNTTTGAYTFTPIDGMCANATIITINVTPKISPTFTFVSRICSGSTPPILPTISDEGIVGTWYPTTVSNTTTGSYTFTPNSGLCANTRTRKITVNPIVEINSITPAIQTVCLNSIPTTIQIQATGTMLTCQWYVHTANQSTGGAQILGATTLNYMPPTNLVGTKYYYVIIKSNNLCPVTSSVVKVVVTSETVNAGTLSGNQTLCKIEKSNPSTVFYATVAGGTWSSSNTAIATITSTTSTTATIKVAPGTATITYTVTGVSGCKGTVTRTVTTVNAITPIFNEIPIDLLDGLAFPISICYGSTPFLLPNISSNGVTGTWNPATIDNTTSNNYIFTPNLGQCAKTIGISVNVNNSNDYNVNDDVFYLTQPTTTVTTGTVLTNDSYLGNYLNSAILPADLNYTIVLTGTAPTFTTGGINFNSTTGMFSVLPNTPAGIYVYSYYLQTNCGATPIKTVTINVSSYVSIINKAYFDFCFSNNQNTSSSANENPTVTNLYNVVTINGAPANNTNSTIVWISPTSAPTSPFIFNADGTFTIAAGTLPSEYNFEYKIISGNYSSPTIDLQITIISPLYTFLDILVYDTEGNLLQGGTNNNTTATAYNVLSNDYRYVCGNTSNVPLLINTVTLTGSQTNPNYFSILPNGNIYPNPPSDTSVIPQGTYTLTYTVCDNTYSLICQTRTVTINVLASTSKMASPVRTNVIAIPKHSNQSKTTFDIIDIPDANLKTALITPNTDVVSNATNSDFIFHLDANDDGEIDTNEADQVGGLRLLNKNISDLTGLQYFPNLKVIFAAHNNISIYNLNIPTLQYLRLYDNPLTSVDVSNLANLLGLDIYTSPITNINVTNNLLLNRLFANNTQLSTIDLGANHNLTLLTCNSNTNLTSINIKNTSSLDFTAYSMTQDCWVNCPNLTTICADDFEIPALQSFLATCGVSTNTIDINSSCALKTNEFELTNEVVITPNPSSGLFTINFQEATTEFGRIEVTTILGQTILSLPLQIGKTQFEINLNDYPSGTYFMKTTVGNISKISKLIKK